MDKVLQDSLEKYKKNSWPVISLTRKRWWQMIQLKRDQIQTMSSEFFRDYVQSGDPELISYLEQVVRREPADVHG